MVTSGTSSLESGLVDGQMTRTNSSGVDEIWPIIGGQKCVFVFSFVFVC